MTIWSILKYTTLQVETAKATFWAAFQNLGPLVIPTSGHTDCVQRVKQRKWLILNFLRFKKIVSQEIRKYCFS